MNDASISLEAGDSWLPVESANFTLTDADENKDTGATETLSIGDPDARIPTITIGSPLTLGDNVKTIINKIPTWQGHGNGSGTDIKTK